MRCKHNLLNPVFCAPACMGQALAERMTQCLGGDCHTSFLVALPCSRTVTGLDPCIDRHGCMRADVHMTRHASKNISLMHSSLYTSIKPAA